MAATVTNRNFTGGGGNSSQSKKKKKRRSTSLLGVFIFTLIFLAVILLFSAIYLSRQLDLNHPQQQQQQQQHHHRNDNAATASGASTNNIKRGSNGGNNDIRNKQSITNTVKVQQKPTAPLLLANNNNNNNNNNNKMIPKYQTSFRNFSSFKAYPTDRLYCMIPFIWNPKIYSAIMNTWGQRCDTIHFLTDAMVGGEINGDHISFDTTDTATTTTRPYWEFPTGTFPPQCQIYQYDTIMGGLSLHYQSTYRQT